MIPAQYRLIGYLAAAAAIFFAGWTVNGWRKDNQIAELKHEHLKAYTENLQAAADETYRLQTKKDEALNAALLRQNRLSADAAHARTELGRVQQSLDSIRSSLPALTEQAVRQYADAATVVFRACAEEYVAVAEEADRLGNAAQTLDQAWPK